jgi:poly-gamma-glutamate synthesis protein (capsule biosynthesis protein)
MTQGANYIIIIFLSFLSCLNSFSQVSFCAVGDILLDRDVRTTIEKNGINYPFESIRGIVSNQDLAFFNMECPVVDSMDGFPINKRYSFRAEPEYIKGLKYAGFNIASVANNHTIDYGKSGFLKTIELLNQDSIFTIGGGINQNEAFKPLLIEKNGETFAFFGMLEFLLEGTTYNENKAYPAFGQINRLCELIKKLNSDIDNIIVSFHWGKESSVIPTSRQVEYAHKAIDAGADLVLGHHPHVLQSIETYHDKLILYSLGNFVFDNSEELQKQSVIFQCKFRNGQIFKPELIPVYINDCRPGLASADIKKNIFEHCNKVSNSFNTSLSLDEYSIKIKYDIEKPIKELKSIDLSFNIYEKKIVILKKNNGNIEYPIPDLNYYFIDADMCIQDNVVYIYSIISSETNNKSRIGIFPFSIAKNEFLQPSLDSHEDFNPWKIVVSDVDNDKNPELILGVHKSTKYYEKEENRIFVFNRDKDYIFPKWLGSKVGNPIIDFKFDSVSKNLVILEESIETSKKMGVSYKWNGFGFDNEQILYEIDNLSDLKIQFQLSDYHFNTVL